MILNVTFFFSDKIIHLSETHSNKPVMHQEARPVRRPHVVRITTCTVKTRMSLFLDDEH